MDLFCRFKSSFILLLQINPPLLFSQYSGDCQLSLPTFVVLIPSSPRTWWVLGTAGRCRVRLGSFFPITTVRSYGPYQRLEQEPQTVGLTNLVRCSNPEAAYLECLGCRFQESISFPQYLAIFSHTCRQRPLRSPLST